MLFSQRKALADSVEEWIRDGKAKLQREQRDSLEGPSIKRTVTIERTPFNVITALQSMGYLRDKPKKP